MNATAVSPPVAYLAVASPSPDALLEDLPDYAWDEGAHLCLVASVRYHEGARTFDCDTGDLVVRRGTQVMVGLEGRAPTLATVAVESHRRLVRGRLPRVLRVAHEGDLRAETTRRVRENEAARAAAALVSELGLDTKVVRAEAASGGGRLSVYLTSEERIDTRELLRRLSALVPARVEIRQVGARDAAAFIGGVGPCGLQLCCNTFLADFAPVSIRMAKDQGLPLHPGRVHGVCGRLLCCLVYEHGQYKEERRRFPKIGKFVDCPEGPARVTDVDVLNGKVTVALVEQVGLRTYALSQVRVAERPGASSGAEPDAPAHEEPAEPPEDEPAPDA